jgi:ribonuclease P protein component
VPGDRQLFLKKHSDYQRAYAVARKGRVPLMGWFAARREDVAPAGHGRQQPPGGIRVGLTVPVALGKAVDRNRIKRRLREAVRRNLPLLSGPLDVILHPRRVVIEMEFPVLEREVGLIFRAVQKASESASQRMSKSAGDVRT